jgi:hypothetical protein
MAMDRVNVLVPMEAMMAAGQTGVRGANAVNCVAVDNSSEQEPAKEATSVKEMRKWLELVIFIHVKVTSNDLNKFSSFIK